MNPIDHYTEQRRWRHLDAVYAALPTVRGATVLDLGCGVGDQAVELVGRGAAVIGIDLNEQFLAFARSRQICSARFVHCDLRSIPADLSGVDGIWVSFAAAYFPNLQPVLQYWCTYLRGGGWLALTEVDDLFAQHPLSECTRNYLSSYVDDALEAGRYDFRMGRRLTEHAASAGLRVVQAFTLPDDEFSWEGPVAPDVVAAWQRRLDGMGLLRQFCGSAFSRVRADFLQCLTMPEHTSDARVYSVIATKQGGA